MQKRQKCWGVIIFPHDYKRIEIKSNITHLVALELSRVLEPPIGNSSELVGRGCGSGISISGGGASVATTSITTAAAAAATAEEVPPQGRGASSSGITCRRRS